MKIRVSSCRFFLASILLGTFGLSCSQATDPTVIECLQELPHNDLRVLSPGHESPSRLTDGTVVFANGRTPDGITILGLLYPSTGAVTSLTIGGIANTDHLSIDGFVVCPYDRRRILVDRYFFISECLQFDPDNSRAIGVTPAGWTTPRLSIEINATAWLSGSRSGADTIAGFRFRSHAPINYIPQTGQTITEQTGPVTIGGDQNGRHRLSLKQWNGGHRFYLDGVIIPWLSDGQRFYDASWSPGGRWLLLGVFAMDNQSSDFDHWLIDLSNSNAHRRFTLVPECVPIGEMEFITEDLLIASGIDDAASTTFLYAVTLDGRVVRRLTH
ncbi:MAG: hypothetical protein H7X80_01140 [bacterium]|nr:hypothetical protein [Candidatus Kapabacteria bacterium]